MHPPIRVRSKAKSRSSVSTETNKTAPSAGAVFLLADCPKAYFSVIIWLTGFGVVSVSAGMTG